MSGPMFETGSEMDIGTLIRMKNECSAAELLQAMETALIRKVGKKGNPPLRESEYVMLVVSAFVREVESGGYAQFFFNDSNRHAGAIADSLDSIGCPAAAAITRKAVESLNIQGEITADRIIETLVVENDVRDDILDECDDMFSKKGENIAERLLMYVETNQGDIDLEHRP